MEGFKMTNQEKLRVLNKEIEDRKRDIEHLGAEIKRFEYFIEHIDDIKIDKDNIEYIGKFNG